MIRSASLSLTALVLAAAPALGQEPQTGATDDATPTMPDSRPLTAEESAALAAALQFDPTDLAAKAPRSLKVPGLPHTSPFALTHSRRPDGSTTYTFKRVLPSLDARVGADLGTGPAPSTYYDPDRPFAAPGGNTGAAWASVDVTHGASIDARLDPSADQGRLATTLHRSVPFGDRFSLTLQNTSGFTDSLGASTTSVPGGLPMRTLPQADPADGTQVWDDQPSLKFDVLSTGTSLTAGLARSSVDPVMHNRIGADQKLYGPLHVSTSVTDIGEATENRSISAGFKFHW